MAVPFLCYIHGSTVASSEVSNAEHSRPPRFGDFELDARAGELLREGRRIRLQQQSLEILLMLLEHPGEPVLREEIRKRLWPNGTLVEFDHSINSAIKKLRQALEDDAEEPRYIETLARRGYRLIASVNGLAGQSSASLQSSNGASAPEIEETPKPKAVKSRPWTREATAWTLFGVALLGFVVFGAVSLIQLPGNTEVIRYEIPLPAGVRLGSHDIPMISPNGRKLVFTATGADGKRRIWFRSLDSLTTLALPGTEGASLPFWSPDNHSVAFWAESTLKAIDVAGGAPMTPWDLGGLKGFAGGTWNRQGLILIGVIDRDHAVGLYRLSDKGGAPMPVLPYDKSRHEKLQWFPQFLPDGRHFVYFSGNTEAGKGSIALGSLDSHQSRSLISTESNVRFVAPGYLVYGRQAEETLYAQRFDPKKLQIIGKPVTAVEGVARAPDNPNSLFSTSDNGVLVYASPSWPKYQLAWYDRKGVRKRSVGEAGMFGHLALSPDEKHVAMYRPSPPLGNYDIWILDLLSDVFSRVTTHPDDDEFPVWSPDGHELIFSSGRTGEELRLFRKIVGGRDEQQVLRSETGDFARKTAHQIPWQWRTDGSILLSSIAGSDPLAFYLWPKAESKPALLLKTDFGKSSPRVSKDGRWVAYQSNESGRTEIYIARFPTFTDKREVSNDGGLEPRWRNDGKELFYLGSDGKVMSVDVKGTENLETGAPRILFKTPMREGEYCVTGDGERFLIGEPVEQPSKPLVVVHNWVSELKH